MLRAFCASVRNTRSKLAKRTGTLSLSDCLSVQHASSDNERALSSIFRAVLERTRLGREPGRSDSERSRHTGYCVGLRTSFSVSATLPQRRGSRTVGLELTMQRKARGDSTLLHGQQESDRIAEDSAAVPGCKNRGGLMGQVQPLGSHSSASTRKSPGSVSMARNLP